MVTSFEIIANFLNGKVNAKIATKVPREIPELFVRVQMGIPRALSPATQSETVAIQVYGTDLEQVLKTVHTIRLALMDEVYQLPEVYDWEEIQGPHDFPDPDYSSIHRWQLSGELSTFLNP